jgi:hypothetical protein
MGPEGHIQVVTFDPGMLDAALGELAVDLCGDRGLADTGPAADQEDMRAEHAGNVLTCRVRWSCR